MSCRVLAIVDATLKRSSLWQSCRLLTLNTNMRVAALSGTEEGAALREFAGWLLSIGEGRLTSVVIPCHMQIPFSDKQVLINRVFPSLASGQVQSSCCILTPLNKDVDDMNEDILQQLPGEPVTYLSADYFGPEAAEDEDAYPVEVLDTLIAVFLVFGRHCIPPSPSSK